VNGNSAQQRELTSDEADLYVTEQGSVKALSIMATAGENRVSTDKGTTSQHLIKQFISKHGGTIKRPIRHRQTQSRVKH
jgi:hypothetical protein